MNDQNGYVYVEASIINKHSIKIVCPFCFSRYKKDGTPYIRAKRIIHHHGNSDGDLSNRFEWRHPHCYGPNNKPNGFKIHINDNTIKQELP